MASSSLLLLLDKISEILDLLDIHLTFCLLLASLLGGHLVDMQRYRLLLLLQLPLLLLFLRLLQGVARGIGCVVLL